MAQGENRVGWVGVLTFALALPWSIAGGGLLPPMAVLLAIAAFPVDANYWRPRTPSVPLVLTGLFLAWVGISFLWSPYNNPEQLPKTLIGVPLYILLALRVGGLEGRWRSRCEASVIFLVIALGLFLLAETLTGGAMTHAFKIAVEGYGSMSEDDVMTFVNRNLGHAAVPLMLLAAPAALLAHRAGGLLVGIVVMGLAAIAAFSFDTEVNALAFILASVAAVLTAFWPRPMIAGVFGIVAGGVLVVPVVLPGIIAALPQGLQDRLPMSWVWRLEIWTYVSDLIKDKPLFGYGLDASRPLNGEMVLDGYQIETLPMHPHNASLQVWLETGLIGAALLTCLLVFTGGRIASAPRLSRVQAIATSWVLVTYVSLVLFSYGVWQEWHQAAMALAVPAVLFLGARKPA
ncbi:O-antigen ligase family protein [uncultured Maricaulis sp.]|uniref:O-antigen ligase family protein n=1 Tax=uncultured Maricaulis sp. TaxID=174710 RepID=UPI0030DC0DE0|tara:strand:+ start:164414 stop:165622 length:1209 start_codon:yes stop_codon:yes gene_type:complete